jgi:hypothetical protein
MRILMIFMLLAALTIGGIGMSIGISGNNETTHKPTAGERESAHTHAQTGKQPAVSVDGAAKPEKIPDRVAYSLFFRMISGRQTELQKRHILSYLKQLELNEADSNALLTLAEEYRERVAVLDNQATQIARNQPLDKRELKKLTLQKEAITKDVTASLRFRLSKDGFDKVQQNVTQRVKRNTKLFAVHPEEPAGR